MLPNAERSPLLLIAILPGLRGVAMIEVEKG